MAATSYSLGIDLGTTFTAAAVARNGRTDIAPLGNRAASIPTLVFLRDDDAVLTGEAAERRGLSEPTRLAREFKRRVGDSVPIMLGHAPYSAERLMAALLKQVIAAVTSREGAPPDRVAVSHPANWGPFKIDLLRHALDLAGVASVTLVTEPVAAAMHYASTERVEPGAVVAVYDLGGGTFDAAVLRKTETGFETLGEPEGIERLGGIDFDEAVVAHVRGALQGELDALDTNDPAVRAALARLRRECVAAKEALSFDSDTSIAVMLPNVQTDIRVTRGEFEPMIRPAIGETIDALRRAIARSGVRPDDLTAVLLVGGSSQIPLVAELVSNALGRPVAVDAHPKHSVALGAAIAAATTVDDADTTTTAPVVAAASAPPTPEPPIPVPTPAAPSAPIATPARALSPLSPAAAAATAPHRRGRSTRKLAVAAAVIAVLVGAVGFGAFAMSSGGGGASEAGGSPSPSTAAVAPPPTASPDPGAPAPAFDCNSESGRCAFITHVALDGDRYIADYETTNYDPLIFEPGVRGTAEDHHVHFFFDTTAPENAGTNGNPPGTWTIWDRAAGKGELRYDAATVDQAGDASRLCVAVADSEHAVEANSGNCVDLPPGPARSEGAATEPATPHEDAPEHETEGESTEPTTPHDDTPEPETDGEGTEPATPRDDAPEAASASFKGQDHQ